MPDLIRNERIKLAAGWCSAIATAILTVGAFTPMAIRIYGIGEPAKNTDLLYYMPYICIVGAVAIHLVGQWFLSGLDIRDDKQ